MHWSTRNQSTAGSDLCNVKRRQLIYLFLGGWLVLNLLQAGLTNILEDEAYYWMYSRFLQWGYFDHPPMIALFVGAGFSLLQSELGVRLLSVLAGVATMDILWQMSSQKRPRDLLLFAAVATAPVLFHAYSFVAVPDSPLLLFTALYFLLLKNYLEEDTLPQALLLSLVVALMFYSKYHGVLVVALTVLAVPRLLFRPSAWLIVLVVTVLMVPHLWWQYLNDFPSIRYHFFDRSPTPYSVNFTLHYIGSELLVAGPLVGWLLYFAGVRVKVQSDWECALKWTFIGIFGFFLLSTFKGRVEAHWTLLGFVPLIPLAYRWLAANAKWRKIFLWLAVPNLALILLIRLFLVWDFLPGHQKFEEEYHSGPGWAAAIEEAVGNRPVIFLNSYQQASIYAFYTGNLTHSLNSTNYRRNQYDLWPTEDAVHGQEVAVVAPWPIVGMEEELPLPHEMLYYSTVEDYNSLFGLHLQLKPDELTVDPNGMTAIEVILKNENERALTLRDGGLPTELFFTWIQAGEPVSGGIIPAQLPESISPGEESSITVEAAAPAEAGEYQLLISPKQGWLPPRLMQDRLKVNVTE